MVSFLKWPNVVLRNADNTVSVIEFSDEYVDIKSSNIVFSIFCIGHNGVVVVVVVVFLSSFSSQICCAELRNCFAKV